MVKVLHIFGAMNVGGAESFVMQLYRHLDRNKVSFDFAVQTHTEGYFDKEIYSLGGKVLKHSNPKDVGAVRYLRELKDTITSQGPYDAIHSHVYYSSGAILALAKYLGIRIRIAHSHSTSDGSGQGLARKAYRQFSRFLLLRFSTHLFACSKAAGEALFGRGFSTDPRGRIIPNAIDLSPFAPGIPRPNLRSEIGIPDDALVIGHVGRFVEVKNQAFLIDILERLISNGVNAHVIFVGDGPLRKGLEERSVNSGLEGNVHFLGLRSDIADIMKSIDVFAFPSLYEGLGIAVIEAQAAGKPCVVSTGVPQEVDLGLNLVIHMSLSSPSSWIEAILAMAAMPPVAEDRIIQTLSARGYDARHNAAELVRFYLTESIGGR
jgi:glycosyltransferase EpsF